MINPNCFLTDKGKLYTVLHSKCDYMHVSHNSMCIDCQYFSWEKAQILRKIKEDLYLYSGIDVEEEFRNILAAEIKTGQEKGNIK